MLDENEPTRLDYESKVAEPLRIKCSFLEVYNENASWLTSGEAN